MPDFGKALTVGLDLLEALEQAKSPLSFAELSRRVQTSPASFTRFLKILVQRGYVQQMPDGAYALGWRLAQLGEKTLAESPLRIAATPHLRAIVDVTQESAECAVFEPDGFVFLDRVESPRSVVLKARPGSRFGLQDTTAVGRLAICLGLAHGPAECSPSEQEAIRQRGFAERLQNRDEVYRAAAAVFDGRGVCVGCLCIGAPAFRVGAAERQQFADLLKQHAADVSRALGWVGERMAAIADV